MKKKILFKQKIYLSEYFKGSVAQAFQKEFDQSILYWDFNRLAMKNIKDQSYNNKLQVISAFLRYLQATGCISGFSSPIVLYYKKNYPTVNEIEKLDQDYEKNIGCLFFRKWSNGKSGENVGVCGRC